MAQRAAPPNYRMDVPIRELLDAQITAGDLLLQTRLEALQDAVNKNSHLVDVRFEEVAHLRDQIAVQRTEMASNDALDGFMREYRAAHDALKVSFDVEINGLRELHNQDVKELRSQLNAIKESNAGLLGRITGAGVIVVLLSLALQVIFFVITHQ